MGFKKSFAPLADVFEDGGSALPAQLALKAGKLARLGKPGGDAQPDRSSQRRLSQGSKR
jgi:hypothetical protein